MDGQIVVTGANILRDPAVNTNSSGGNDGQGTISIQSGQQVFETDDIVVFNVVDLTAESQVDGGSGFVGITVYDSAADYMNGIAKYSYTPMNPGQEASVQSDISGLGDGYVRFNANVLVSSDPSAPRFNQLIVAGGRDLVSEIASGPVRFDRNQDFDFDGDGTIDPGTIEEGDNLYATAQNTFTMVCFAEGTPILTPDGYRGVETLVAGDRVVTRDHGAQAIVWHGARQVAGVGAMAPIRFEAGAIGNRLPLYLSPQHRVLVSGARVMLDTGTDEALVAACHLVDDHRIRPAPRPTVTYHHLLCRMHEVLDAGGAFVESLHPGHQAMGVLDPEARSEIETLFPELAAGMPSPTARQVLRGGVARRPRDQR